MRFFFLSTYLYVVLCSGLSASELDRVSFSGSFKARAVHTRYPENSIFNQFMGEKVFGRTRTDKNVNVRLDSAWEVSSKWSAELHYEIETRYSEGLSYPVDLLGLFHSDPLPNDDRRLMNLTRVFSASDERASFHRLDRLSVSFQGDENILKLGRQAVSWGNGLIYTPMDFFNPFDPARIDTEYKPGDDMLYAQHLFLNGDDAQVVYVARRKENGDFSGNESSLAMKYHGFLGESEFDVLVSQHYNDEVFALGVVHSLGGTIVRGDVVLTKTSENMAGNQDSTTYISFVANLSYSWVNWGKNMSGVLEYFHNGFGLDSDEYNAIGLQQNPELLERISRGELFTLGKNYMGLSVLVEISPLWLLTPNLFINGDDGSGLFQLVTQHDITQNIQVSAALSLPFGGGDSEFGGLEFPDITPENRYASYDSSIYLQGAWYF